MYDINNLTLDLPSKSDDIYEIYWISNYFLRLCFIEIRHVKLTIKCLRILSMPHNGHTCTGLLFVKHQLLWVSILS